jgi:hypothetical protein
MNTDQKLLQLVDRLLIKTQDELCGWRRNADNKYILTTPTANIEIYHQIIIGGKDSIKFEINRDHITLIGIFQHKDEENSNLIRLYNAVTQYYQNYVDTFIDDLLIDIQKR